MRPACFSRVPTARGRRPALLAALLATALAFAGVEPIPARATSAAPHWSIASEPEPTTFAAGATDAYVLIVRQDGAAPTARASTVTVTDSLPSGATAEKIAARAEAASGEASPRYTMACSPPPVTGTVACTYAETSSQARLLPGTTIVVTIAFSVPGEVLSLANSATVSGGGAPSASTQQDTPVGEADRPFGLSLFQVETVGEGGEVDTQAGSHPFELTATVAFDVAARELPSAGNEDAESPLAAAAPKDLEVELPAGLVGDANAVPRCSQQVFLEREGLNCPLDTQVGTIKPFFYGTFLPHVYPVFDVAPPPGQPAELGFTVASVEHIPLFFHVRDDPLDPGGEDYGLTAQLEEIPEAGPLQGAILTLWGVPAAASHDLEREGTRSEGGEPCRPRVDVKEGVEQQTTCPSDVAAKPFLTLPSDCATAGEAISAVAYSDSWQQPSPPPLRSVSLSAPLAEALTGCEQLSFEPSLALAPESAQAGVPSGYTLDVNVPQDEDPSALATPDLRSARVSLPAGVVVSPSVANGLAACTPAQFEPSSPEPGVAPPAACPPRSQLGTVKIATPLLSSPLEGAIYLGTPECAPCTPSDAQEGLMLRLLLEAQGSPQVGGQAGVTVKLEGHVSIDQASGRLTASFPEDPQLPIEDVELAFDGGANAPLANPPTCDTPLAASAQLTPYSGQTPAEPSSQPFELGGCEPGQFHPSLLAGTTDNQAGASSALTVTLLRGDQEGTLRTLSLRLAPGLLGMISKVAPCGQAQARTGACGPQSRIGSVTVEAGAGANPLVLEGSAYLTGPYEGAPYGLSLVVPALAGPLDLGTIVIGAKIEVDPSTAALTITSDPLPQSLDGIPLQIKALNLNIGREGFIVNPTDCQPLAIEGSLVSGEGAPARVSSRFQAANCARLAFKPKLTALTHAQTDKAGGVHLHVRIVSGPGQADIEKLRIELPGAMVPRLSTWQGACPASTFDASPASCPTASVAGSATVITPLLRDPLTGPVYAISRGRQASPEIALVLRGEGVVLEVIGQVSVAGGVAAATFASLPDVPLSMLDVMLDAGPHSLLAANLPASAHGSMCARRLSMPTAITAQDGAVVKQTTTVAVSGCHPAKRKERNK
jgi:hypothetical protein